MAKEWFGSKPKCDFCKCEPEARFVDGKTRLGPWAIMCEACYEFHGRGIGLGLGQMYERVETKWLKVAG